MKDTEEPAYVLNYRAHPEVGTLGCTKLVTLIKGPFATQPMEVYVRREDDPTWTHIKAAATISDDYKILTVVVPIGDNQQTFTADSATVLRDIAIEHPSRNW